MAATRHIPQLDAAGREALAARLGDDPGSTIEVRALETGRCRAWAIGDPSEPRAAVLEWDELPGEFMGSGDPEGIWEILRETTGWTSVLVADENAPRLARLIRETTGRSTSSFQDIGYLLRGPVREHTHPWVHLLRQEDLPLLEHSPILVRSPEHARFVLEEGPIAAAVTEGEIVAVADTAALTDRFGEVGVETLEAHRGRGLATAAASLVCRELQRAGRTPRWSTGEHNLASRRVAQKLGFAEHGRETYVVPER